MNTKEDFEEAQEKIENGWIHVWFIFEVMAVTKEAAEEAIKKHIERLDHVKNVKIYEVTYHDAVKVDNPPANVKEAWSQVSEVKLVVKSLFDLVNITILYAPSAIEIIEPKEYKIKIDEVQNMVNIIAGLVHRFAAAGVGGVVIRS
ncbi:MAG: hypothetical protein J7L43_01260 [Candidatus Aenigmarchaeota archaeon]|nr:hypothetical protein [Candidatus Aenigmarchaeota archaeon]